MLSRNKLCRVRLATFAHCVSHALHSHYFLNLDCAMNNSDPRIPEAIAPKVFARAAHLYAQAGQGYSLEELIQAGAAANIPPEFIRQAVQQVQAEQAKTRKRSEMLKQVAIAGGIVLMFLGWRVLPGSAAFGCHAPISRIDSQTTQSR